MNSLSLSQISNLSLKATRDGFGEGLLELGEKDSRVVVLTADVSESTRVEEFAKRWPDRFVECGVAEQNMAGIAAGLAACGKIPFLTTYAVFSPGRNWDQIRLAAYSNLNIKVVGCHTGLSVGPDGATHQALEDIALMRVLPNMRVMVPADANAAKEITIAAAMYKGPVYLRLTREKTPLLIEKNLKFSKTEIADVVIIGCGPILNEAVLAAEELEKEGIKIRIMNCDTIKPINTIDIVEAAKTTGAIVTIEEHQIFGGLGSAVAEVVSTNYPVPMEMVGIRDMFGESGKPEELIIKYGIGKENIKIAVKKVMQRKK